MKFFDMHIHTKFSEGESTVEEIAQMAKRLGLAGVCLVYYINKFKEREELEAELKEVEKRYDIKLFMGFKARNLKELRFLVEKRREYDFLFVKGGDLKLNRKAVETPEVDILTHPEFERFDSGLNHIMVKLAKKNNVAIEFNFREVMTTSKVTRSNILKHLRLNMMLCKKYGTPIVITSGAVSHWEMKDPLVLSSFGILLGLDIKDAKRALSETPMKMIKMVRERRSKRWIRPGVRIV